RAHDPARGTPIHLQVTEVLDVLVPIIESVRHMRRIVAPSSCLHTSGHGQHLPAVAMMPARRLEACATGSACSPT
ncbi:MAG TPA: hypothetical protein DEF43_17990, partial [Chloroflexus aurantiacus]|nr:hypothetical protein [Chloroflexus aurantiacus]